MNDVTKTEERSERSEVERGDLTKGKGEPFQAILARRLNRRDAVRGAAAAGAVVIATGKVGFALAQTPMASPVAGGGLTFTPLEPGTGPEPAVAEGYTMVPFLKWGDPITADAPAFDIMNQSAAAQEQQVGYNCDYIGFLPLPMGSNASDHGILVVNHEYTNGELMFPGYATVSEPAEGEEEPTITFNPTQEIVDIELAAHGMTIIEIARGEDGTWAPVLDSQYNRRITATTPTTLTGPAAGSDYVKTSADADGLTVLGTLNNCAGGMTPWGTVISGEENFNQYFANAATLEPDSRMAEAAARFGIPEEASERQWENFYDRFDLSKEPNEPNRFGWAVEVDPYDPASTPKRRTALGRAKWEAHTTVIAPSGQAVVYSGDDQVFEYVYKFVTEGTYDPNNREANMDLLDSGTRYVAKFNDDGTGEWLPLVYGEGELTDASGFTSQAEVLTFIRMAGDLVGATKMDRPEDFETDPVTGKIYLNLTNNRNRGVEDNYGIDAANPRAANAWGHIIEMTEDGNDPAATTFTWSIFILAGPTDDQTTDYAGYDKSQVSGFSAPDNLAFDVMGNLWISTDGNRVDDANDGLFAVPTEGPERGFVRRFFTVADGAECSGPMFTPDNSALFIAVQHPGEGGTFESPITTWPDPEGVAPRPSVVLVTRADDPTAPIVGE